MMLRIKLTKQLLNGKFLNASIASWRDWAQHMINTNTPSTVQRGAYRLLLYDAKNKATKL
jgi:hypothetical protein